MAELRDIQKYVDAWTKTQLDIWQEKIRRMNIVYTGRLLGSFTQNIHHSAAGSDISMKFAKYGIYQALGVGNGFKHDNGGDLQILNKEYRKKHGLDKKRRAGSPPGYITSGKPHKARDWFAPKLYMSVMAMTEDIALIAGEEAARVVCDALSDAHNAIS